MPTPFIEERLDITVAEGSAGGPGFKTEVFTSDAGFEQRNVSWSKARARYDLSYGIRHEDDFQTVLAAFYVCQGRATGFRLRDWGDYRLTDELIATGDGAETVFQIIRTYTFGSGNTYVREIKKPVDGTMYIEVNDVEVTEGVDYTVDYATGIVTFASPVTDTHEINITCEFDVPVRFDIDQLEVSWEAHQLNASSGIEVVELKDPS